METKKWSIGNEGKKWLISIVVGIFILSVPVLFVAWGMTWKWTSFAPGGTDAWIGFWGGYMGAIIGALAAGAIAYFVAHRQINLQTEKDHKREKKFLATQLRIQKYEEVYSLLSETNREFAISEALVIDYYKSEITLEELKRDEKRSENNIIAFRRKLRGLAPFVEGLDKDLDTITKLHRTLVNIVYDTYIDPKQEEYYQIINGVKVVMPPSALITNPKVIEEPLKNLMDYTADVCKKVNEKLKDEIEQLEKKS